MPLPIATAKTPSVYELAQLARQLRQAELEHWQTAVVPAQRPVNHCRGNHIVIPAPYHIWAAKPNGRPQYPAVGIRPYLNQWAFSCYLTGCRTFDSAHDTFASAVSAGIRHCQHHGMQPGAPPLSPADVASGESPSAPHSPRSGTARKSPPSRR